MATAAATAAFVARASQRLGASGGRQRTIGQLAVSPFGFGAYRLAEGDVNSPSLQHCLEDGIVNVIDTSSSYSDGASESRIGDVVADTLARGTVKREEIVIVTKIGHVPAGQEPLPENCVSIARDGGEPGKHSIHPAWLQQQCVLGPTSCHLLSDLCHFLTDFGTVLAAGSPSQPPGKMLILY